MPSAPTPLPTPPATSTETAPAAPSTGLPPAKGAMDPYAAPPLPEVFVQKRRTANPPPLQMPQEQQQAGTASPSYPMPVHGHAAPYYQQQYVEYAPPAAHSPMHPQSPMMHGNMSPHAVPVGAHPHAYGPHTHVPYEPCSPHMHGYSHPHPHFTPIPEGPTGGCSPLAPPAPLHHPSPTYGLPPHMQAMGRTSPMTPMTPMTPVSDVSHQSAFAHPHHAPMPHPGMVPVAAPYPMHPQQGFEMGSDRGMSPTMSVPASGTSTPTYPMYAAQQQYDMNGYPMQQPQQYSSAPSPVMGVMGGYPMETYGTMESPMYGMQEDGSESADRRRARRIKNKKDEQAAVDAIRYKTKLCRNWEMTNRCPYGQRCLFAHGRCELRSTFANTEAIAAAARTQSPERMFYELGRFPNFVPMPTNLMSIAETVGPHSVQAAGMMA